MSRRGLLTVAGLGTGTLAGCSSYFPGADADESGPDRPEYDEAAVDAIPGDVPEVRVEYPAGIDDAYLTETRERSAAFYDHVPSPIGSEAVPNRVVRETLQRLRNRADLRRRTADHDTLDSVERTAGRAGAVAYAYDAAVGDLDAEGARERREAVRAERAALQDAVTYVGDDPIDTLVTIAAVEAEITVTGRRLDELAVGDGQFEAVRAAATDTELTRGDHELEAATDALGAIAEVGRETREAAVAIANAEHLLERFEAATEGQHDYEARFERVGSDLLDAVAERAADYDYRAALDDPLSQVDVDADVEGTPAETVLSDLLRRIPADVHIERSREVSGPADLVVDAHRYAHRLDALERAVALVEDGRFDVPADADELASRRRAAVDALETAVPQATYPRLTERQLAPVHFQIRSGDEELSRPPSPWRVQRAAGAYGAATVLVDVLPGTNEWLVDALA